MKRAAPIILFLAATAAACDSRPDRVVIGVALSKHNHPGIELAVKEINASGGIDGVPIELMGLELASSGLFEAADTLKWANRFAETKDLLAVIGHGDSASTLSAAAIYNQKRVPQIVTIATNPAITNIGDWTYRLCLSDVVQGPVLAQYAVEDWGKRRIAVFYVNDSYGRGIAELFERRVRELGGEIVSSIMHRNLLRSDDKELIGSALLRMKERGEPELIVLFQRMQTAHWTIGAIRERGIQADILGGDSLSPMEFVQMEPKLVAGIRISQFFLPSVSERAGQFAQNLRRFSGKEADYARAFAYDGVYLIRDAIRSNGFSRQGVKAYLDWLIKEKTVINGAGGAYLLGADHDARRPLYIVEARDGGHRLLATLPVN